MEWQSQEVCDFSSKPHLSSSPQTHPPTPTSRGRKGRSFLYWCPSDMAWFPTCMWEKTQREEGAEKISGVRPRDPGSLSPWQAPSSHAGLSMNRHYTGSAFSHSLIPPPARVNIKPPHLDVLYFPVEIRFRVNTVTAAKALFLEASLTIRIFKPWSGNGILVGKTQLNLP